jgi:hypothetical protein
MGGPLVNLELGLPQMFWWEGPDGSRLLTLYNNNYGTSPLPPDGWPYKTWVYISMTGDNQGPPSPDTVKKDIEFYRSRGIAAKVGKLDDFGKLILKEDLSRLPVVRSDIPDPWIHGMTSMPEACKLVHNMRPLIGAADQLTTLERCWGIFMPDIHDRVNAAYEQSMLFSEHTWGLANQHYVKLPFGQAWNNLWDRGLPPNFKLMEDSWKEKAGHVDEVQRLVAEPYAAAVLTLADQVNVPDARIVVYNPLPWRRDGEVVLNAFHMPIGNSLKPVDGGPAIPIAKDGPGLETPYRVIRFAAQDVPPMGYRSYMVSQEKPIPAGLTVDEKAGQIESPFFKATLDPKRGRIVSLVDKRSGRELVDASAPQGFGQYFYERFGYKEISEWLTKSLYPQYEAHKFLFVPLDMPKDGVYSSALPENMTLAMTKTPIDVTAVMTGVIPSPGRPQTIYIRLTLPAALPAADLEVGWQKQPDSWPEAAWICLPFKCEHPRFRLGRVGADLDPTKDFTVDNANYHMSWVNTGVSIYDGESGAGVALCPQDSPIVSLGEPGLCKFDKRYEPTKPYVYINLYNNQWRSNFAAWIGDGCRMTSRVRLWAFDRFNTEGSLYSPAMEARVPLAVARSTARAGQLPPSQSGIELSRKGIAVTAFGPNPDGPGTVLRLWEQAGQKGSCTVHLPATLRASTVQPVDLRGRPNGPPIPVGQGQFTIPLHPYAPASLVLEPR